MHHKKLVHELAGTFVCPIGGCEAAFHNQKNLDFHISEHEGATGAYRFVYFFHGLWVLVSISDSMSVEIYTLIVEVTFFLVKWNT